MKWTVVARSVPPQWPPSPRRRSGPWKDQIRQAYGMILSQADANKDWKAFRSDVHGHLQR